MNGDLLLYRCDVAAGGAGHAFIDDLATATGADVAASTDLTGGASLGGDWVLEAKSGVVEATAMDIVGYGGVLSADSLWVGTSSRVAPTVKAVTNHTPTIVTGSTTAIGSITEVNLTTDSATSDAVSGSIAFADLRQFKNATVSIVTIWRF